MSDYHEIHSGGQKHYQLQDLSWFLIKLFISFDTDQNLFFDTFKIKVNYLLYTEWTRFIMQKIFFGLLHTIVKWVEVTYENAFFRKIKKKTLVKAIALRFLN